MTVITPAPLLEKNGLTRKIPGSDTKEEDMSTTHLNDSSGFRLTFDGSMTIDFANELEDRIISAMRQHRHLEVDLSGVREIDLCGIHLIRLLQTVGGKAVNFVATSPIVERAINGLHAFPHRPGFASAPAGLAA